MGLAAGQARLLTITGRKSDCEYESMRLSHQKLALSRQLTDLSNEYQNSLDQTKLIYDYYGTGDESNPLSYGILMTPSALNDYMPILITNPQGRATLNSKYAAAAEAAGIPQEGLGTLPSETMRNKFIEALSNQDVITTKTANTILGLPYNQAAGMGGGATVAAITKSGKLNELVQYFKDKGDTFTVNTKAYTKELDPVKGKNKTREIFLRKGSVDERLDSTNSWNLNLGQLLGDDDQYYLDYKGINGEQSPVLGLAAMQRYLTDGGGFVDWLADEFSSVLDLGDAITKQAIEYATTQTQNLLLVGTGNAKEMDSYTTKWYDNAEDNDGKNLDEHTSWKHHKDTVQGFINGVGTDIASKDRYDKNTVLKSKDYIGFTTSSTSQKGCHDDGYDEGTVGINLNNIAKAFLTYYADYVNGVSKTDLDGSDKYYVKKGNLSENKLITDDTTFTFTWKTGSSVSSDDCAQATFYDALFNQICQNGWTQNNNIDDSEYLQEMLKSGMLYISKIKDDGYYYQGNYATDSYIKEVSDDTKIAQAEAKYNTEKSKLNSKEETLDLKMKNLDTEISSLTTEYDTIKNTISKNIEKSFKRYNA